MGRPSNKPIRRRQIAEALMRVMATEGYDGATVTQIAEEAGLTPGLVHYHFGGKLDILLHMMDLLHESHRERLAQVLEGPSGTSWERLCEVLDAHLAVGGSTDPNVTAAWVAVGGEAMRHDEVKARHGRSLGEIAQVLRAVVAEGRAGGEFRVDQEEAEASVAALVALIQGYFGLAATQRSLIPRGSAAESARRMARGLLRVEVP